MTVFGQLSAMSQDHGQSSMSHGNGAPLVRRLDIRDEAALGRIARHLATVMVPGDVILLIGDLGAGKTTFARHFIRAHGITEDIPSPTFSLVQTYDVEADEGRGPRAIWHFDLYRLDNEHDLVELGVEEAFAEGVTLIEWPDRLGSLTPADRLEIELDFGAAEGERVATLRGYGVWARRLAEAIEGGDGEF